MAAGEGDADAIPALKEVGFTAFDAVDKDGKVLASCSADMSIKLWDFQVKHFPSHIY